MTDQDRNKAIVLEAFDTLFNERDYTGAERFWKSTYIQHSRLIPPGRDGLFNFVKQLSDSQLYEAGIALAEGDYVMLHGRYSGSGRPSALIAVDIVRMENGLLAEHWDVLQDEASADTSASGLPMFGDRFPSEV